MAKRSFGERVKRVIANPKKIVSFLSSKGFFDFLSDKDYVCFKYKQIFNKKLDLDNPQTFNEKLQWLKLYNRNPEYTAMVDKYEAKKYISQKIGEKYIIPTLGVWDKFDDIDFNSLPDQFVLKCTHDSGGLVICRDKSELDLAAAKKKINKSLKTNYYMRGREWPYKDVKPRIIAEKYMTDESHTELKDYKIFCFNGKPEYVEVDFNRQIMHKLNTYDFDWNPLNFCDKSPSDYSADIKKPKKLEEMRKFAAELSRDIPFLRVDFYSIDDDIYVGELTFYPGSGFIQFKPIETDLKYGKLLNIEYLKDKL